MSNFAFSSKRKKRTYRSRIRPLSRSSLPFSPRTYSNSTFLVSFSCTYLMFWKNPYWSPMRICFSRSTTTWRSKKRMTAALRTFLSRLHACRTAPRNCASLCQFSGTARLRASHQLQPDVQLPFGHFYSNLALVFVAPRVGSPIQRPA